MASSITSPPDKGSTGGQAATPALPMGPKRPGRLVTDAPMRMFHWLSALCFAGGLHQRRQ